MDKTLYIRGYEIFMNVVKGMQWQDEELINTARFLRDSLLLRQEQILIKDPVLRLNYAKIVWKNTPGYIEDPLRLREDAYDLLRSITNPKNVVVSSPSLIEQLGNLKLPPKPYSKETNLLSVDFGLIDDSMKLRETLYDTLTSKTDIKVPKIDKSSPNELIIDAFQLIHTSVPEKTENFQEYSTQVLKQIAIATIFSVITDTKSF